MSSSANQGINRRSLILLHVEENEIRARRIHAHVELFQEIRLHQVERRDEECAEPKRKDNGPSLVCRAIQVCNSLPNLIAPALAQGFARDPREKSSTGCEHNNRTSG